MKILNHFMVMKIKYFCDETFDEWVEINNVSQEDIDIIKDTDIEWEVKQKIYEKYKKKRTQGMKDASHNFTDSETAEYNNGKNIQDMELLYLLIKFYGWKKYLMII